MNAAEKRREAARTITVTGERCCDCDKDTQPLTAHGDAHFKAWDFYIASDDAWIESAPRLRSLLRRFSVASVACELKTSRGGRYSRVSGEVARKRRSQARWPSAARASLRRSSCPRPKLSSTLRLPVSALRSCRAGLRGTCCAAEP